MRLLACLLLLSLCTATSASPLITAVVPDLPGPGPGDEAFALTSAEFIDIGGYTLSDGEGEWTAPPGTHLEPNKEQWFVANNALWQTFDMPPGIEWSGPRLANDGDDLALFDASGNLVDAFAWGDGHHAAFDGSITYRSPGLIYRRAGPDTDAYQDWQTPRTHRVGETQLDAPIWQIDSALLYSSPDSSFMVLSELLASAQQRAHLHVYQLRSQALVDQLVATPAADLQVLVTRSPIGADQQDRNEMADALRRVQERGGEAWLGGTGRYDFHHLKVLVADDAVAIQSENWVTSGVPEVANWGNRGWGIVLYNKTAADWFANWMADDRAAWDTERFVLGDYAPEFEEPVRFAPRTGAHVPRPPLRLESPMIITPVVSPDHTFDPAKDPIASLASHALYRLWVQQLDVSTGAANRLGWHGQDPLAAGIEDSLARGVDVRVQAAAPFAHDDTDNREALDHFALQGALVSDRDIPGIATMHNKGIIADDAVVIGSINGNHHSRSENREVAVIVASAEAADWYAEIFEQDFAPEDPGLQDVLAPPAWPPLMAMLLLAAAWRWRYTF